MFKTEYSCWPRQIYASKRDTLLVKLQWSFCEYGHNGFILFDKMSFAQIEVNGENEVVYDQNQRVYNFSAGV